MKTYDNILFQVEDGVGVITFNRESVLNSFNFPMADDVIDALEYCRDTDEVRAIVITGNGRGFCAGQDLEEATRDGAPKIEEIVDHTYNPIIQLIRKIEKPVIGAVNGVAAGAGANIALACDITFACESAKFIQSFSNIGLVPDSGGTFFLPRLIGLQRATALMYTADKVTAEQAKEMGMIYDVALDHSLMEKTLEFAKMLAMRPTKGIGLTKRALNASFTNNFEQQLEVEKELQAMAASTHDHNEGIQAFFEKRRPEYTGK